MLLNLDGHPVVNARSIQPPSILKKFWRRLPTKVAAYREERVVIYPAMDHFEGAVRDVRLKRLAA